MQSSPIHREGQEQSLSVFLKERTPAESSNDETRICSGSSDEEEEKWLLLLLSNDGGGGVMVQECQ